MPGSLLASSCSKAKRNESWPGSTLNTQSRTHQRDRAQVDQFGVLASRWFGATQRVRMIVRVSLYMVTNQSLWVIRRISIGRQRGGVPPERMEEAERPHPLPTLKETKWVLSRSNGAAARLGINRSTLQFRMKKLGIVRFGRENDASVASEAQWGH